jgi:DNA-binding transcriptional MerR regulator
MRLARSAMRSVSSRVWLPQVICSHRQGTGACALMPTKGRADVDSRVTRGGTLMHTDEFMTIGRFSRLSGLSIHALRHYDDVHLLHPADVDESTGCRRYLSSQLRTVRLIVDLRWLNVSLEDVRMIVTDPSSSEASQILARHHDRLTRTRDHQAAHRRLRRDVPCGTARTPARPPSSGDTTRRAPCRPPRLAVSRF